MTNHHLPLLLMLAVSAPSAASAQARTCGDLWWRRNDEYKAAGYCFHTPRGIQAFGNAGCRYDDIDAVPLSEDQRAVIRDITEQERDMGCR